MQIKTRYICDVCQGEYMHREMCEVCEAYPNPTRPDIKAGQKITVYDQNFEPHKCIATHDPELVSDVFLQMQYHYHDQKQIVEERLREYGFGRLHQWIVRVSKPIFLNHQFDFRVPVYGHVEGYMVKV